VLVVVCRASLLPLMLCLFRYRYSQEQRADLEGRNFSARRPHGGREKSIPHNQSFSPLAGIYSLAHEFQDHIITEAQQ